MLPAAFSQVDTGTIAGTVRDSQGAAVANAKVTFVETSTNVTTKTQTDGSGDYASPPLRPGSYKITAEAPGFKTATRAYASISRWLLVRFPKTLS
jgi:Carboxypeptidase regulatory-like domain